MLRMTVTIYWIAIALGLLSRAVAPEATIAEDSCLYLLPIHVNLSHSMEYVVIASEYITNFTVIKTNIDFICEAIFPNNKALAIGEIVDCTRGLWEEVTFATEITSGSATTMETNTIVKSTSENATYMTSSTTVATNSYRIEPNVTFTNITDMCPTQDSSTYWQQEAAEWISNIYIKVIGAIGLPGNTLAFAMILTMKPVTSPSLFIAVLAASDNYVLLTTMIFIEMSKAKYMFSVQGCGFILWTLFGMGMFSHWLVVLMTVERFVVVRFPLRAKTLCTKKNAVIAMITAWVVIMGLNVHMWTIANRRSSSNSLCGYHLEHGEFSTGYWFWVIALFNSIIPGAILIFCNVAIIHGIRRSLDVQRDMRVGDDSLDEKAKSQRQTTSMLLAISNTFIILTGPMAIFDIIQTYWHNGMDGYEHATYNLIESLLLALLELNYGVNFYMYFLTGRKFRVQLAKTFGCYRQHKRSVYRTELTVTTGDSPTATDVSAISESMCGDV